MDDTKECIQDRKLTLSPIIRDWPVPDLVEECPECGDFFLYCCTCNNTNLDLPAYKRPTRPCHDRQVIFVGGSCMKNGRHNATAGVGVAYSSRKDGQLSVPITDDEDNSLRRSNQRAEIYAAIHGLKLFAEYGAINVSAHNDKAAAWVIATDSEYVVKGITEWFPVWRTNDWRTTKGTRPVNLDLFLRLDTILKSLEAKDKKIGFWHVRRKHNTLADDLAKKAATDGDLATIKLEECLDRLTID